jgi:hypothetical protein
VEQVTLEQAREMSKSPSVVDVASLSKNNPDAGGAKLPAKNDQGEDLNDNNGAP